MNVLTEIRKRVLTQDGKRFVRGAQSRLAEKLDCSRTTVKRYFIPDIHGEFWRPGDAKIVILRELINQDWKPKPLKSGQFERTITAKGKTLSLSQWSTVSGIDYATIRQRLRSGWKPEIAVSQKPRRWRKKKM